MTDYKNQYDIFICGGSKHVEGLKELLPKLYPFGRVHLGSITLTKPEREELRRYYDVLHEPRHDPEGYINYNLFCIRDINRLARGAYFIKLDADVDLSDDWIDYVKEAVAAHPEAVLFGPVQGGCPIDVDLSGAVVRRKLGRDIRVVEGQKVTGGFYVGKTSFFRRHDVVMQTIHAFLYGVKKDWSYWSNDHIETSGAWVGAHQQAELLVAFKGVSCRHLHKIGDEDTMRSLTVHAVQASGRIRVLDSAGRIWFDRPSHKR